VSKRLHESTVEADPLDCCGMSVGSRTHASNRRWIRGNRVKSRQGTR
jgi:hypothetical protein